MKSMEEKIKELRCSFYPNCRKYDINTKPCYQCATLNMTLKIIKEAKEETRKQIMEEYLKYEWYHPALEIIDKILGKFEEGR